MKLTSKPTLLPTVAVPPSSLHAMRISTRHRPLAGCVTADWKLAVDGVIDGSGP